MKYKDFIQSKRIVSEQKGISENQISINNKLFDFQKDIVRWSLIKGKTAIFAGCGLGKTFMQIEWARNINDNVLILAPLAVSKQTIREAKKLNVDIKYCRSSDEIKNNRIIITNYEMFHNFNMSKFSGIVLDESSILKSYSGKIRNLIIESTSNIPFKLACTATPAPNDFMEYGNHSEFLNILPYSEMLAMFFVHDGKDAAKWRLKGHAEDEYWKWLASWSVMLEKPSNLGYSDKRFALPELKYFEHIIGKPNLFSNKKKSLIERRKARSKSINERVEHCANMINKSNDIWIVWCNLNAEGDLLEKEIKDSVQIQGSDSQDFKEKNMLDFADNKIKCLITKPSIAGHGMNWQNSHNAAFVGLSDSWEEFYQAVRRQWRFGQNKETNVHIIISSDEGCVLDNIRQKEFRAKQTINAMIKHMHKINERNLKLTKRHVENYKPKIKMEAPDFI